MSVIMPVEGSGAVTLFHHTVVGHSLDITVATKLKMAKGLTVQGVAISRGRLAATVNAISQRVAQMGLTVSVPRFVNSTVGVMGLTVGDGRAVSEVASMSADIQGLIVRRSPLALSVSQLRLVGTGPMSLTVQSSASARSAFPSSLVVRGLTRNRSALGMDVRAIGRYIGPQSLEVREHNVYAIPMSLTVGGIVSAVARLALDTQQADSFMILADVIGPKQEVLQNIGPAGYYPETEITARLFVNAVEVPITAFDYTEPPDKLGAALNITLARPMRSQVPLNATIRFELVVAHPDMTESILPLVSVGKIGGRDYTVQWRSGPADELSISSLDVLNDKFSLRPGRPIVMFDPNKVEYTNVAVEPADALRDSETRAAIMPMLEPVTGLNLLTALQRAFTSRSGYGFMTRLTPKILARLQKLSALIGGGGDSGTTVGLGFNTVITNIPNYDVSRVDFSIESGWADGITPLVSMYGPMYSVIGNNNLLMLSADRPMPAGFVARVIPISKYLSMGLSNPYRDPYNAVILTYQVKDDSALEETYLATRFDQPEAQRQGQLGDAHYQEVKTLIKVTEIRRRSDDSLVDEFPEWTQTETFAATTRADGGVGPVILVQRERQTDLYTESFKTGHHKVVEGLILVGQSGSLDLRTVLQEDCEISWIDDTANPGRKVQERNFTRISGLVYESDETVQMLDPATGQMEDVPKRVGALVAQASGIVTDDGRMYFGLIRTITKELRNVAGQQLDVLITDRNVLMNTIVRSTAEPTVGGTEARSFNKYATKARQVLFRNRASELEIGPRVPVSVNAGELPEDRAFELARLVLAKGVSQPENGRFNLPGVDFAATKGSVVKGQDRDGTLTVDFLVRGRAINGTNLGQTGHRISENLDGVELKR